MPELPEAEVAARQLRETGLVLVSITGLGGRHCAETLSSLEWFLGLQGLSERGKLSHLFIRAAEVKFMTAAELGMTGLLCFGIRRLNTLNIRTLS